MRQRGSSIVEVVVMMVIMSVSLIGIYSLVNSGQNLARTADERLIATNLAKEWLESIGALRDTFLLRAYTVNACLFTIDTTNLNDAACYSEGTNFFLKDDKTLSNTEMSGVCITGDGWYSQELAKTGTPCANAPKCSGTIQKECLTPFTRTITFATCGDGKTLNECTKARVTVAWWTSDEESLSLEQIFTRH